MSKKTDEFVECLAKKDNVKARQVLREILKQKARDKINSVEK